MQTASRVIGHLAEADTAGTGSAILDLDRADDENFAVMAASATAGERIVWLRQMISVSSTSTRPARALRPAATMLRRSLAAISQADL